MPKIKVVGLTVPAGGVVTGKYSMYCCPQIGKCLQQLQPGAMIPSHQLGTFVGKSTSGGGASEVLEMPIAELAR